MPPDLTRAFLDWLVTYLTLAMRGRGQAQAAREETVTAPLPGAVATTAGVRPRNSNAFRRPGEATHTYQAAGETWSLGDDPRALPPLMPRRPQPAVPDTFIASPQPFASLATQNELADFLHLVDDPFEVWYTTVFSKALAPHVGESGVADYPCEDPVREKLWRRRGLRGSPYPAWGEWSFLLQEYPSEQHPYQSGLDGDGPYVAGIMQQDWRHLDVTDIMPLFVNDGELWLPDGVGVFNWLAATEALQARLTLIAPRVTINGTPQPLYANVTDTFYDLQSDELWTVTEFDQPVKHYRRGGADTVRQVTYERREYDFPLSGGDSFSEDGTIVLSAGDVLTGTPQTWWYSGLTIPAVVDGNHAAATEVKLNIADLDFVTFVQDNVVQVRFFPSGGEVVATATAIDLEDRGVDGYWLILASPVTVPTGAFVQRHSLAVPKSGSRTYYVSDEAEWTWEQFPLVQVHRQGSILNYRVTFAVALTFSRAIRLYEGNSSAGELLNEHQVVDVETYGIAALASDGNAFSSVGDGITSGGPNFVTGGANFAQEFSETPGFGGDLPACTFLGVVDAGLGIGEARHYRFNGPLVMTTAKPVPAEPEAGIQPSDYQRLPQWSQLTWGDPWETWTTRVNPLIYDGIHGQLHNPAGGQLGSTWLGLEWDERWYAADALVGPDGELIGVVLLDDEAKTLMVSVNGVAAWSGSVFDLLPCGGDSFHVTHPGEGGPESWPPEGGRNDIYRVAPHYNFLHPSWPFPTALVGPFAVRARIPDDRAGVNWRSGVPTPPVVVTPIF